MEGVPVQQRSVRSSRSSTARIRPPPVSACRLSWLGNDPDVRLRSLPAPRVQVLLVSNRPAPVVIRSRREGSSSYFMRPLSAGRPLSADRFAGSPAETAWMVRPEASRPSTRWPSGRSSSTCLACGAASVPVLFMEVGSAIAFACVSRASFANPPVGSEVPRAAAPRGGCRARRAPPARRRCPLAPAGRPELPSRRREPGAVTGRRRHGYCRGARRCAGGGRR
jgi:hypothetical protein